MLQPLTFIVEREFSDQLLFVCVIVCSFMIVMDWTSRLLTQTSTHSYTNLTTPSASSAITCSGNIDDYNKHIIYQETNGSTRSPTVTSALDDRNSTSGTGTVMTSSSPCASEHRAATTLATTTTSSQPGAPVRTVSISRSGRYKSKSKQRARLSDVNPVDTTDTMQTASNHKHGVGGGHVLSTSSDDDPSLATLTAGRPAVFVNHQQSAPVSATDRLTTDCLEHKTTSTSPNDSCVHPSSRSPCDGEDFSPGLEIAFESTSL